MAFVSGPGEPEVSKLEQIQLQTSMYISLYSQLFLRVCMFACLSGQGAGELLRHKIAARFHTGAGGDK